MEIPLFWRDEQSGVLAPAVGRYLSGEPLSTNDIALLRVYLRQWICSPVWQCDDDIAALRDMADSITSRAQIALWLDRALQIGIDPL